MDDVEETVSKPRKTSRIEKSLRARKQRKHVKSLKLARQLKLDKEGLDKIEKGQ